MSDPQPADDYDLPPALVEEVIDRLLAADTVSRPTIESELLARHPDHASALSNMFADLCGGERLLDASFADDGPEPPPSIRGYRALRQIGEGAFGVVHLCEQTEPVTRMVAIKVLRPGAGDRRTLRRFEAERQLLASLNHRSITQIFDAGQLDDGRPYFVMEYVDGLPLTAYCEHHELDCDARLQLFVEVCLGVEHAHARGIVHRDLKPANVLVVDSVPAPLPKIIDFGVAKAVLAVEPPSTSTSGRTEPGRVIGTPGYMSPEQAAGRIDEVDARADVFALGVMLYELLAGAMPFARDGTDSDREPIRPSSRLLGSRSETGSGELSTRQRRAARIRGDLDWITLQAVALERERRYQSVRELIDDLERHRHGHPVHAGPPSVSYRLRKFVGRNRVAVVSALLALVATAIGVGAATVHANEADAQNLKAHVEAAASFDDATTAARKLLQRASDEHTRRLPQSDGVRQLLLHDAIELYDKWLKKRPDDPALQRPRCQALILLSRVHWQLGQMPESERLATEACAVATALFDARPDDLELRALLADAQRKRSQAIASAARPEAALAVVREASAHLQVCFEKDPKQYGSVHAEALRETAILLEALDRSTESLEPHARALAILESLVPDAPSDSSVHGDVVIAAIGYAQQLMSLAQLDDAERVLHQNEARLDAVPVERQRAIASLNYLLAEINLRRNQEEQAISFATKAVTAAAAWVREEPDRFPPRELHYQCTRKLGTVYDHMGRWDESTAALQSSIDIARDAVDRFPDDPLRPAILATTLRELARMLWDRFRLVDLAKAEEWAHLAVQWRDKVADSVDFRRKDSPWQYRVLLASIRRGRGEPTAAEWENIAAELKTCPPDQDPADLAKRVEAWTYIARSRVQAGQLAEAAAALDEPHRFGPTEPRLTFRVHLEIASLDAALAAAQGDHATAAAAADRILELRPSWLGKRAAAQTLLLAWHCAPSDPAADGYRDRAALLFRQAREELKAEVEQAPDDPFVVVPYGFSALAEAEIEYAQDHRTEAKELLQLGLPALRRVDALSPRDTWEAERFEHAQQLERELAIERGR